MEFDLKVSDKPTHLSDENIPNILKSLVEEHLSQGVPFNINVIEHYPDHSFDRAAIDALKQWVFKTQSGEKFETKECLTVTLNFIFLP